MCAIAVAFAPAEQELYMHVFERARTKYQMFRSQGSHMVSKRLIQIMSTLLPLRRICSGGQLSNKDLAVVSSLLVLPAVKYVTDTVLCSVSGIYIYIMILHMWCMPCCGQLCVLLVAVDFRSLYAVVS